MRRFATRLTAALLTFALGVLIATVRSDPRFSEALRTLYGGIVSTSDKAEGCYANWANVAESNQPLGWDLTYASVVAKTRLCPGSPLCEQWLEPTPKRISPIYKHISEWQGDPIISSIEFEFPDGHASMVAWWLIRTKNQAYIWSFHPWNTDYSGDKLVIPTDDYDPVFEKLSCWLQIEPEEQKFGSNGYLGFLSMYKAGKSRQMLLTYADFIEGGKYPDDGVIRPGPFSKVLTPLVLSVRERLNHASQNKEGAE